MKKRILKIIATIVCVLLFLYLIGYFHNPISVFDIDRVVLQTDGHGGQSDDVRSGTAELGKGDIWMLVTLYNLSRYDSHIDCEPCCDEFCFDIYFRDGNTVRISEGCMTGTIVTPVNGERYYAHSKLLLNWIELCIAKYHLNA